MTQVMIVGDDCKTLAFALACLATAANGAVDTICEFHVATSSLQHDTMYAPPEPKPVRNFKPYFRQNERW